MKTKPYQRLMKIDRAYLANRAAKTVAAGYAVPKWITFCTWALDIGLYVQLYDAVTTVSKYVYLQETTNGPMYKIRFSNHKPNKGKEFEGECDFFVGVTNTGARTTGDAMIAVRNWLDKQHSTMPKQTALQKQLSDAMDNDNAQLDAAWEAMEKYL